MSHTNHAFAPSYPTQRGKGKTLMLVTGIFAAVASLTLYHEAGTEFGWISIMPSLIVLVVAISTHRTLEALAIGALSGLIMLQPDDFIGELADISLSVMMNETIAWLILVCGLMGGFIAMLEKSGCTMSFSHFIPPYSSGRRTSVLRPVVTGTDRLLCHTVAE
jgi:hypothetical protein